MLDLIGKRNLYYILSLALLVPGIISLLIPPRLVPGIEFTSGTTMTLQFTEPVDTEQVRTAFAELDHPEARIQRINETTFLIRTRDLEGANQAPAVGPAPPSEKDVLDDGIRARVGPFQTLDFAQISPTVSQEIAQKSALAIVAASAAILLYISFAFRAVPRPFRYGIAAIVALLHDTLLVIGIFSILGKLFGTEINTLFIVGLLTVMGFSVHDTIVVFDRIRENLRRGVSRDFGETVNISLTETLVRSINTSMTVILVLLALLLLGGPTIRDFLLVLLIGIVAGTYSSIFIASQILVSWEYGDFTRLWRRFFGGSRGARTEGVAAEG
jgi:preprotein translocase subunit SecF